MFSLDEFNSRLLNFNYGYAETDKPIPILLHTLQSTEKPLRSASQMITLVQKLPFLIGDKVQEGDKNWSCYLLLRKIIDIILSPRATKELCVSLKLLIRDHHEAFIHLYGVSAYIPKMHFLTHYPEQIQAIGPMIRSWTIRHEAKLNFFKRASRVSNFKNISFTLANNHQRWICYELTSIVSHQGVTSKALHTL